MLHVTDMKEFIKGRGNILGVIKETGNKQVEVIKSGGKNGTRQSFCHA